MRSAQAENSTTTSCQFEFALCALSTGTQVGGDGAVVHGWTARQLGWRKCGPAMSAAVSLEGGNAERGSIIHADELACEDDLMYASIGTRYLTSLYWAMQVRAFPLNFPYVCLEPVLVKRSFLV